VYWLSPGYRDGVPLLLFCVLGCFAGVKVLVAHISFMELAPSDGLFQDLLGAVFAPSVAWILFEDRTLAFGRCGAPVSDSNL